MESSKAAFLQRKRVKKIIICTFFCAFFIFGSFSFNDYGISTDEWVQRQHGLVNLKYVCQLVNRDNIPDYLADIPMNLDDYGTMTYYGIGIKIPLIIAEYLSDFKMSNQQIIHMNHLYTFLIFFVATLYVYRLLKLLGFDFWYTFAGVILFVLCPRTFADSFYNIKDSVFLSLFVIMLYYGIAIIKNFNWKNVLGIILSAAFCLNTRIIGCFPLFFIIIFYIFQSKKNISKRILTISLIGFISFLVYVLITPAFWIEGVKYILNVGNVFSDYTYGGPYLGNSVKLPWYYLTVSIIVTLPTLYTVLFSIGWLTDTKRIICRSKKEDQLLNLIYIQFTTIMVYDVVMRPIKYNMWRHFYFLLIYIVIFMLYGIRYLMNRLSKYKIYVGLGIGTSVFLTTLWIIKYHPFEYVYLNPIFSPFIDDKERSEEHTSELQSH